MRGNVEKFFELYNSDAELRRRVSDAEMLYPGSLEIREAVAQEVLLPIAEELGLGFTLAELFDYEGSLILARQAREEAGGDGGEDDELSVYWLIERGWSNDEARFCGDK